MPYDVLIVDDSSDDVEMFTRSLAKVAAALYSCRSVASGAQALEAIRYKKPDCVLLDYSLPGQDGIALLSSLKTFDRFLPVIILTGQGNESVAVKAIKEGAADYLIKSGITSKALHRSISSAIEYHCQEQKIQEQRLRIEQQAEELERINEELETFTYIASHDLRSPLVNLRGFCGELHRSIDTIIPLLDSVLPHLTEVEREVLRQETCRRIPKSLTYIRIASEKMDRMTDAILKLSRLGRQKAVIETIDTRRVVQDCLAALTHQIEKTNTTVTLGDLPEVVCDRNAMEQIFGNLLDNAIKYLDPTRPGSIRISGIRDQVYTTFMVEDNGRGIAKEDMHKVFEIFRRAGDVENIPGEGMGMPYVRSIVKRYGGYIWCDSTPDQGTSFYFTIAHQKADKEAA